LPLEIHLPSVETYQETLLNRRVASMAFSDNGRTVSLTMDPVDDNTMKYTTLRYTDSTGTEKSIRIENAVTTVAAPGLKTGAAYSLTSTYNPVGAGSDLMDALPSNEEVSEQLKMNFTGWTVMSCSDGYFFPVASNFGSIIDGNPATYYHSQWQGGIGPFPHWILIDMKQAIACNITFVEMWRSPDYWLSDSKTVQFFVSNTPDPNGVSWVKITEGVFPNSAEPSGCRTTFTIPNGVNADYGRYMKVVLPDNWGREAYVQFADFNFYGKSK
jgi:hypothetical protein